MAVENFSCGLRTDFKRKSKGDVLTKKLNVNLTKNENHYENKKKKTLKTI